MHKLRLIVLYAWAFPATAVGLVLALFARANGATILVVEGTIEVGGGRISQAISALPRRLRFNAITLGHVILGLNHTILADCRVHERVHVSQYERWGILFFPLYFGSSLLQIFRGKNPYWDNHFELQARQVEALVVDRTEGLE